ncbi:hypothetical protein BDV10DRAFT_71686 [Aspergillus recurvatus]
MFLKLLLFFIFLLLLLYRRYSWHITQSPRPDPILHKASAAFGAVFVYDTPARSLGKKHVPGIWLSLGPRINPFQGASTVWSAAVCSGPPRGIRRAAFHALRTEKLMYDRTAQAMRLKPWVVAASALTHPISVLTALRTLVRLLLSVSGGLSLQHNKHLGGVQSRARAY